MDEYKGKIPLLAHFGSEASIFCLKFRDLPEWDFAVLEEGVVRMDYRSDVV